MSECEWVGCPDSTTAGCPHSYCKMLYRLLIVDSKG